MQRCKPWSVRHTFKQVFHSLYDFWNVAIITLYMKYICFYDLFFVDMHFKRQLLHLCSISSRMKKKIYVVKYGLWFWFANFLACKLERLKSRINKITRDTTCGQMLITYVLREVPATFYGCWIFYEKCSETTFGCTAPYFVKIIWCPCWLCSNPHSFEAVANFICGRQRITRHRMICLV